MLSLDKHSNYIYYCIFPTYLKYMSNYQIISETFSIVFCNHKEMNNWYLKIDPRPCQTDSLIIRSIQRFFIEKSFQLTRRYILNDVFSWNRIVIASPIPRQNFFWFDLRLPRPLLSGRNKFQYNTKDHLDAIEKIIWVNLTLSGAQSLTRDCNFLNDNLIPLFSL